MSILDKDSAMEDHWTGNPRFKGVSMSEDEALRQRIKELGNYLVVDFLRDGTIIGMGDLMFTRAIYIDLDLNGWGKRFCFEDKDRAVEEYMKLQTGDDEPTGYVARRGR